MEIPKSFGSISHLIPPGVSNPVGINSREKAYWIIRDKIIYMDLKPGEPLSDKSLAEQMQMSRTPVREALILLSAYNMVVMKPQIGTFVSPIDAEWVAMEQFSRLTMEKEIIHQACAGSTAELYRAYKKNIDQYTKLDQSKDPNRIRHMHQMDNYFHSLAFAHCGKLNSFFHMHSYMQHIERLRVLSLILDTDKTVNSHHLSIATAVSEHDTKTAIACLEEHLSLYKSSLEIAKSKNPEYFELG